MRALILAGILMLLSSVGALGEGTDVVSPSERASKGKAPAELIGTTLSAIQAGLLRIKGEYPQLSEFAQARLSDTRLDYEKGQISWPKGKMGGPQFNVKDGCHLRVSFGYPVETEPTIAAMDQGLYCPYAGLSCSLFLFSDLENPHQAAFEKAVRDIVMQERAKLAEQLCRLRLEEVCRTLKARAGGEWEPGLHSGFHYSVLVVRGRLRDASGKTVAQYDALPVGAAVDRYALKALGSYANAQTTVSILGVGPRFTVVELLRAGANEAVRKARGAVVQTLELSPPKITVDMYRSVLTAAERALGKAQAKSFPGASPAIRASIATGQTPFMEERDGGFRFVWEMLTNSKTGYRIAVERAKDGKVSVLEVELGL
jgi:hypothetical protein